MSHEKLPGIEVEETKLEELTEEQRKELERLSIKNAPKDDEGEALEKATRAREGARVFRMDKERKKREKK